MKYSPQKIERKWQRIWQKTKIYKTKDFLKKKKFYILDMFPYPSGAGLHVGHLRGYIATDVISRMKMMQGHNVLHPMGWDAFGLPAENYALQHKIHPEVAVRQNIKNFKKQLSKIGFTYDWSREINTTDPNYYKWTQWIFLQLFKAGLVYESFEPINWCPVCKTGLANEDLEGGKCERCGSRVEKRPLRQWIIKITKYAERLLKDLKYLNWPEHIIKMQENWIGKSEGVEFKLKIVDCKSQIVGKMSVFTTRIDTVFGMTYVVLAPENKILGKLKLYIKNWQAIEKYKKGVEAKLAEEREKEKSGIKVEGILAENPFNGEKIPIFVSEYVLADYATGSIMAVPAHDKRDFDFAKKFGLTIKKVIEGGQKEEECYEGEGILVNSGQFSGFKSKEAKEKMVQWLKERKIGKKAIYYKIRDWVFARQRYWGEPFPLVFCENCKKRIQNSKLKSQNLKIFNKGELLNPGWICISERDLPVLLPKVKYYEPTGTGESPLVKIEKWVKTKCPKCGNPAKRETNTMPQWAGSCWYYLRYIDPKNDKEVILKKKEKYWMPVDLYVGGAEHATRHLIYARFWHKFLYDIGIVSTKEPFLKLKSVGIILGSDSRKMSKRYGNVINPDDVCKKFGADALRVYEMFMGPFDQMIAWQEKGISGARRFLERVWKLRGKIRNTKYKIQNTKLTRLLHQTIKKVTEDIDSFKFNTAISQLMILANELEKEKAIEKEIYKTFIQLLAPFAPHITEELWYSLRNKKTIFLSCWPKYNPKLAKEEKIILIIQVNGKIRDKIEVEALISEEKAKELALSREKIKKRLVGKEIKRIIFIPRKLINFVVQ